MMSNVTGSEYQGAYGENRRNENRRKGGIYE